MLKFAFVGSLIGILALYLLSTTLDYPTQSIDAFQEGIAKLEGTVESVSIRGNTTLLTISQPATLEAVAFFPVPVQKGMKVELLGERKEGEVIISRVRILENIKKEAP